MKIREQQKPGEEMKGWVLAFAEKMDSGSSINMVLHHFIQLGVADPCQCGCEYLHDPVLGLLHRQHRRYNQRVHTIIMARPGMLNMLKIGLMIDLCTSSDVGEEYGTVALKSYARNLLEHFLVAKPTWC